MQQIVPKPRFLEAQNRGSESRYSGFPAPHGINTRRVSAAVTLWTLILKVSAWPPDVLRVIVVFLSQSRKIPGLCLV